jgi:hypothetical protein
MTTEAHSDSPLEDTREHIFAQHRHLRELTELLTGAQGLSDLLLRLQEFRSAIVVHFAAEEAPDGFFQIVGSRAARHLEAIQRFEAEHYSLLDDVDRLAARARECLTGPVAGILQHAGELARRLQVHEARENDMLINALYEDLGEED